MSDLQKKTIGGGQSNPSSKRLNKGGAEPSKKNNMLGYEFNHTCNKYRVQ